MSSAGAAPAQRLGVRAIGLAAASLAIALAAALASFRLPFPAVAVSLDANAGRMLAAAAVGMCLAVSAALRGAAARPLREAYVYAASVGAAAGVAVALMTIGGPVAAIALAAVGGGIGLALVRAVDRSSRAANLGLAFVLLTLFLTGVPAYMTAATERDALGGAAIWLLGDVSRAHGAGSLAIFLAAVAGCCWAAAHATRSGAGTISALLFGLALGVGGPVAFVGGGASSLVRAIVGNEIGPSGRIALTAILGASLVMLADATGRLLIGGYAPPLNLTIGFVAVPAFLWWNRRRLTATSGGRAGPAFEIAEAVVILASGAALLLLAYGITGFVRLAT